MLQCLALVLLSCFFVAAHGAQKENSYDDLMEKGRIAHKALEYKLAAKIFHKAMKLNPKIVDPIRFLGDSLYRLGEFDKARKAIEKAHRADPSHRTTRKMLADTFAATGNFEDALWHFGQVAVSSQITLPPLSDALVEPWVTPASKHPSKPLPEDAEDPRVFFTDPRGIPKDALHTFRDWLSTDIVGDAYNFEFRSSSMKLKPEDVEPESLLEQAIAQLRWTLPPAAREAAHCAEWWVHRRPPRRVLPKGLKSMALEGHPFHWDNDGAEADGENPLFTSLLYLTAASGSSSPTVVLNTSKTKEGFYVGDAAWIVPGREGRIAYIHGGMLHGVLPSAGNITLPKDVDVESLPPARISLNVAWWPHECRVAEKVASVEGVPEVDPQWALTLKMRLVAKLMQPMPVYDAFCGDDLCGRGDLAQPRAEL